MIDEIEAVNIRLDPAISTLDLPNVIYTALRISASCAEMLQDAKSAVEIPFSWTLPCGEVFSILSWDQLDFEKDTPCPCGNENHWFVRYIVDPDLDNRKVEK